MNTKTIYYVEGACEKQLISALKELPAKLLPGKIRIFNVIQNTIPKSQLLTIQPGTNVVFAFDTDVAASDVLKRNIELVKRYCPKVKMVYLVQVLTIEDELVRATDVKAAPDLTHSDGLKNFKTDFCKMNVAPCRSLLEHHHIDTAVLWTTAAPAPFDFLTQNSEAIKLKVPAQ